MLKYINLKPYKDVYVVRLLGTVDGQEWERFHTFEGTIPNIKRWIEDILIALEYKDERRPKALKKVLKEMHLENELPDNGTYCSAIITYIDDNQEYMVQRMEEK